jgi:hypothetical protein
MDGVIKNRLADLRSRSADTPLLQVLNNVSADDLVRRYSVNAKLAAQIVAHRPYTSDVEILEKAIIPKRAYERIAKQLRSAHGSGVP